jgi:hypothetical protein
MSEPTCPESTDNPPVGKKRELFALLFLLSNLAALIVFYHWKGHTWPAQVKRGILIGPLPPLLVLIGRSWNRCFEPDRNPVRWPNGSEMEALLSILYRVLAVFVIVCMSAWIFVDRAKIHALENTWGCIFVTVQMWNEYLSKFIDDRKFIPPPSPTRTYDPSQRWDANLKRLHSDHWGERETPRTESFES